MAGEQLLFDPSYPLTTLIVAGLYVLLILGGTIAAGALIFRTTHKPIQWAERMEWLRTRPWGWRDGVTFVGIIGLLIGLGWGITALLDHPREGTLIIVQGLTLDLAGLGALALFLALRGWSWKEAFGMGPLSWKLIKYGLFFYLILIPFMLMGSLIYQGILSANGYPPSLQDIALLLSGEYPYWVRILMFSFAVVVAPAFEECLFRGILLPMVVRKLGLGAGIFIISFAFAAIHAHLSSFIPLLIIATGFSLAYLYTRSLWVPIIMHGLFNGINLAVLLVMPP